MKRTLATLILVLAAGCTGTERSDSWMQSNLNEHKADFQRLIEMANEDYARSKVIRIAYDFTRLDDNWGWPRPEADWGVTKGRWDEYRNLFRSLNLPSGLERTGENNERVQLMIYGVGMAGEGTEYGYLWSPSPPAQVDKPEQEKYTTRPFGGDWYRYEWTIY
jgi:hypothetical protein